MNKQKRFWSIFGAVLLIFPMAYPQQKHMVDGSGDMSFVPNGVITTRPLASNKVEGSVYLYEQWYMGEVDFKGEYYLENKPIRYDLDKKSLEIQFEDVIKSVYCSEIERFEWLNNQTGEKQIFLNATAFNLDGVPLVGMIELLAEGDEPLLLYKRLVYKEADYVPAFNVGSPNPTLEQEEELYLAKKNALYPVKKNKKQILALFGDKASMVEQYAKENQLNFSNQKHLQMLVQYYNTVK